MPVQPTIVAGVVAEIAPIVNGAGLDFHTLLERVDLKSEDLEDPDNQISLGAVCELLEIVSDTVGNDAFGLELARQYPVGRTGVLGCTMLAAANVRQSLQDVQRYTRLLTPQLQCMFEETEDAAAFVWEFPECITKSISQYAAITVAILVGRIRLAAGDDWMPENTTMEIPRPNNVAPYFSVFGKNLVFGATQTCIEIPRDILELPMPNHDEQLHKLLRELGDYRMSQLEAVSDIVDRTQDRIIALLNHGPVSLEMVARDLGQSARSLQRRLKEEGTSFQVVFEKTRRLLARHHLRTRQHTLTEVAYLLGFSEQSAFTRACKRWFDATPYEMRMRLRTA